MNSENKIRINDIWLPPNLMSLLRILLTIPIGYFLAQGDERSALICLILMVVAGLTDFLDGFLARRLNQITELGLILDPLADKILAIVIIIELIVFRDFPLWLALMIFARDVVIIIAGMLIVKRKDSIPASTLTGKYYFGSIATLIISWISNFEFGQIMFLYITLVLYLMSSIIYARKFIKILKNRPIRPYEDRAVYKYSRHVLFVAASLIYIYRFYIDVINI